VIDEQMKRLVRLIVLIALCQSCVPEGGTTGAKEKVFRMPGSILQGIGHAVRDGDSSCDKKTLFSRDFFELADGRLLILVGIPDYLCASNSFMPVTVDDKGRWLAGAILPGAPSWIIPGPDNGLWLAAQWQVEGTFPALYRSLDGVDWQEIKLPENRDVDCCFEKLERICFRRNAVRLEFASAATGKTAFWEAAVDVIAGTSPAWRRIGAARGDNAEFPCPSVPLGRGSWIRDEADGSGGVAFKKIGRQYKISVVIPAALE
jgi:hypothetical protein